MQLTILERLMLLSVLPEKGDFLTLKIVRKLREGLSFDEGELKDHDIRQANGSVNWKQTDPPYQKDIEIGEKGTDLIVDALKAMNDKKELTEQHFGLYEKFVEV